MALVLIWHGARLEEDVLPCRRSHAEARNARTLAWPPSNLLLLSPEAKEHPLPADSAGADCAPSTLATLRGS